MKVLRSVLIVDDSEPDAVYAEIMLRRSKRCANVAVAGDAEEALAMFVAYEQSRAARPDAFPPQLVLLDINMPRMTGFEFLEAYEALELPEGTEPSIVVMLSSSANLADRRRAEGYDAVAGYVTKPLDVDKAVRLADAYGSAQG